MHHISPDLTTFHQIEDYKGPYQVHVGYGNHIPIHHTSNSTLPSSSHLFCLNKIHVSSINKCLLSIRRFSRDNNVFPEFHQYHFDVFRSLVEKKINNKIKAIQSDYSKDINSYHLSFLNFASLIQSLSLILMKVLPCSRNRP